MAKAQKTSLVLALDSGALILLDKKGERIEAIIRRWLREGASIIIPAPVLAEVIRGSQKDSAANRLIKSVDSIHPTTAAIARDAGERLALHRGQTIDALIVATAEAAGASDILTSDPDDISALARTMNVISLA